MLTKTIVKEVSATEYHVSLKRLVNFSFIDAMVKINQTQTDWLAVLLDLISRVTL